MKILDIKIKDEKGNIIHLKEAELLKNKGILGDKNAKGGRRQVSILSLKTRKNIEKLKEKGLCIPRFYENIIVDHINISKIQIGQEISFGDAILEISEIGKECFLECKLFQDEENCSLINETIFARVIKGGKISL